MKLPTRLLLVVAAGMLLLSSVGFTEPTRRWNIKNSSSTVVVELNGGIGQNHSYYSLTLKVLGDASITTSEEASCLNKVLDELPDIGVDPTKITLIYLPQIRESDVKTRLIDGVVAAEKVGKSLPIRSEPVKTLVDMLNSAGAYDKIIVLLERYGLSFSVMSAESVRIAKMSELKLKVFPDGTYPEALVPIDAQVYLGPSARR